MPADAALKLVGAAFPEVVELPVCLGPPVAADPLAVTLFPLRTIVVDLPTLTLKDSSVPEAL